MAESPSRIVLPGPIALFRESVTLCVAQARTLFSLSLGIVVASAVLGDMLIGRGILSGDILLTAGVVLLFSLQVLLLSALLYTLIHSARTVPVTEALLYAWDNSIHIGCIVLLVIFLCLGAYTLFIVPGIYFQLWFSFALFVYIAEGKRGGTALLRNRAYVRGYEGKLLFRFLFLCIFLAVISFLFGTFSAFSTMGKLLTVIAQVFIIPWVAAYFFLIYSYVKRGYVAPPTDSPPKTIHPFVLVSILGYVVIFIFGSVALAFLNGWGFSLHDTVLPPAFEQLKELQGEELPTTTTRALQQLADPAEVFELAIPASM